MTSEVKAKGRVFFEVDMFDNMNQETLLGYRTRISGNSQYFVPFKLNISNKGGSISTAINLAEMIDSYGVQTVCIIEGFCASMACVLPQYGNWLRLAYPSTLMMFHGATVTLTGDVETRKNSQLWVDEMIDQSEQITAHGFGMGMDEVREKLCGPDRTFFAKDVLMMGDNGGIDGIIIKTLPDHKYIVRTRDGYKEIDSFIHNRDDVKALPVLEGFKP